MGKSRRRPRTRAARKPRRARTAPFTPSEVITTGLRAVILQGPTGPAARLRPATYPRGHQETLDEYLSRGGTVLVLPPGLSVHLRPQDPPRRPSPPTTARRRG